MGYVLHLALIGQSGAPCDWPWAGNCAAHAIGKGFQAGAEVLDPRFPTPKRGPGLDTDLELHHDEQ